jgi:MraZ protein
VQIVTEKPEFSAAGESDPQKGDAAQGLGAWNDLEFGFCGNPRAKLDDRGRLKMPAEFKAFIEKKYGKDFNEFYITSQEGLDAEIYPLPEWRKRWAKLMSMPPADKARKELVARYTLWGGKAEMDPQGRLLLPDELRSSGMMNEDVSVNGEGNVLRVTPVSRLRETVQGKPLADQHLDRLAQFGL